MRLQTIQIIIKKESVIAFKSNQLMPHQHPPMSAPCDYRKVTSKIKGNMNKMKKVNQLRNALPFTPISCICIVVIMTIISK